MNRVVGRRGFDIAALVLAAAATASACSEPSRGMLPARARTAPDETHADDLAGLTRFEEERRARTDFARAPDPTTSLGSNPYRLLQVGDGATAVGILRGADAVVLIDRHGRELDRAPAPPSPTALAVDPTGLVLVGGTASGAIAAYRVRAGKIARVGGGSVEGAWTVRALAVGADGHVYAADQRTGRVTALAVEGDGRVTRSEQVGSCHSPIDLAVAPGWLVVDCLADHALVAHPLDARGEPVDRAQVRVAIDGPIWSMAVASSGGRTLIAAGGVEDHPLERRDGGFGYIDSYLYLYELTETAPRRLGALDLSAVGIVTPKWVRLELVGPGAVVQTAGYATDSIATVTWSSVDGGDAPTVATRRLAPGTTDWLPASAAGPELAASPLLDGWIVGGAEPAIAPAAGAAGAPARSIESRIGEALFFTTLMAPWNTSEGKRSRFTCETCHFEAYGDGRVHFTGRGAVHSTTKPLRGLFNNRPHFTRALDRTMASMIHAEFRVANRWSGRAPWFALPTASHRWLAWLDGAPPVMSPVFLRRSFMSFLMDLAFEPNQAARGRERFRPIEREGAELFRDRCASCHAARLVTADPATQVPFERWERLVLSPQGPIVWASAEYQKTGVEPYVHERGARTTSLRRAFQKYPYFTNGSARSLAEVVERAAWRGGRFFHDRAPSGPVERLDHEQRASLLAFLELL